MSKKKVAVAIVGATGVVAGLLGYIAYLNKKDFDEVFGMHDCCDCDDDDDDDYLYEFEDDEEYTDDDEPECSCEEVNPDVLYAPFSKESERIWREFIKSRNADVKQYKDSLEYMRGHNGFGGLSGEEAKNVREMAQSLHFRPVGE